MPQLTYGAPSDQLQHLLGTGVEAVHEGLHELHAVGRSRSLHLQALGHGQGQGLFAEDVFPLFRCLDAPLQVLAVGQGL